MNKLVILFYIFLYIDARPARAERVFLGDEKGVEIGGVPEDVRDIARKAELCYHFGGEPIYSARRRKEVEREIATLGCNQLVQKVEALKLKYINNVIIIEKLKDILKLK